MEKKNYLGIFPYGFLISLSLSRVIEVRNMKNYTSLKYHPYPIAYQYRRHATFPNKWIFFVFFKREKYTLFFLHSNRI